jgi:hypothetical protein
MQGAQNLRSEAYLQVRRNNEGKAQRRRWTFYEAIIIHRPTYNSKGVARSYPATQQPLLIARFTATQDRTTTAASFRT